MSVGILGSGFGLYGYLPSLVLGFDERIILPARYQAKLSRRDELAPFAKNIEWVPDDAAVPQRADTLIISRRPEDQVALVMQALRISTIRRFILEKPIAPTPVEAHALLDVLERTASRVRISYIFRFEPWADLLAEWVKSADESEAFSIRWNFRAHHHVTNLDTWKRRPAQGGGAIRFYGVQLIGLLAELGYTDVMNSQVTSSRAGEHCLWTAALSGRGLPRCLVSVDTTSDPACFEIRGHGSARRPLEIISVDPFGCAGQAGALDRRIGGLTKLYGSLLHDADAMPPWYRSSVQLWQAIEVATPEPVHVR